MSLFGTFAAVTLCAIALVVAKAFGYWGVMAMVNAWLVAIAGSRIMRWTHLLEIPLPTWTWLELGMVGLAAAWIQAIAPRGGCAKRGESLIRAIERQNPHWTARNCRL